LSDNQVPAISRRTVKGSYNSKACTTTPGREIVIGTTVLIDSREARVSFSSTTLRDMSMFDFVLLNRRMIEVRSLSSRPVAGVVDWVLLMVIGLLWKILPDKSSPYHLEEPFGLQRA
jgi:hypothetical protein